MHDSPLQLVAGSACVQTACRLSATLSLSTSLPCFIDCVYEQLPSTDFHFTACLLIFHFFIPYLCNFRWLGAESLPEFCIIDWYN